MKSLLGHVQRVFAVVCDPVGNRKDAALMAAHQFLEGLLVPALKREREGPIRQLLHMCRIFQVHQVNAGLSQKVYIGDLLDPFFRQDNRVDRIVWS